MSRSAARGKHVVVIGAGMGGLASAIDLAASGFGVTLVERHAEPGGKIARVIPESRFPVEVFKEELQRVLQTVAFKQLPRRMDAELLSDIRDGHAFTVIATGADVPRRLSIPGAELSVDALEFLAKAKNDQVQVGKRVVIVGAGNVGCDAATEAYRLGAIPPVREAYGEMARRYTEAPGRAGSPCCGPAKDVDTIRVVDSCCGSRGTRTRASWCGTCGSKDCR